MVGRLLVRATLIALVKLTRRRAQRAIRCHTWSYFNGYNPRDTTMFVLDLCGAWRISDKRCRILARAFLPAMLLCYLSIYGCSPAFPKSEPTPTPSPTAMQMLPLGAMETPTATPTPDRQSTPTETVEPSAVPPIPDPRAYGDVQRQL